MTDAKEPKVIKEIRGFIETEAAPPFRIERYREILAAYDTLARERDAARQDAERLREVIDFARIELGGEERDGSEHTHWCVACDDHVDGNYVVRNMLTAALTQEDA
jgi:hypothetical protein